MAIANAILNKPNLSKRAFWDTKLDGFDFDRYANFAIIRVLERGTTQDIREIIKYYGRKKVETTVTSSKNLQPKAVVLSKRLFRLSYDSYKCLEKKPQALSYSQF